MYNIDIILRGNPVALSVQRKEAGDAKELYRTIREAMSSVQPKPLELTCEKNTEKMVAVLSSDVAAVQINASKSGGTPIGMRAGFFTPPSDDE